MMPETFGVSVRSAVARSENAPRDSTLLPAVLRRAFTKAMCVLWSLGRGASRFQVRSEIETGTLNMDTSVLVLILENT
jgi:hypothetical protein